MTIGTTHAANRAAYEACLVTLPTIWEHGRPMATNVIIRQFSHIRNDCVTLSLVMIVNCDRARGAPHYDHLSLSL
jgi:hypothetical protein